MWGFFYVDLCAKTFTCCVLQLKYNSENQNIHSIATNIHLVN